MPGRGSEEESCFTSASWPQRRGRRALLPRVLPGGLPRARPARPPGRDARLHRDGEEHAGLGGGRPRRDPRHLGASSGWRAPVPTSSSARTTPPISRSSSPEPELALPGLHIAEVVADRAARDGRRRVGCSAPASRWTDRSTGAPSARGASPPRCRRRRTRAMVNRIIFDELVNGVFTDASRAEYVRIIEHLAARGCDAVALVCTEIPLLVTPDARRCPRWTRRACWRGRRSRSRSAGSRCRPGEAGRGDPNSQRIRSS